MEGERVKNSFLIGLKDADKTDFHVLARLQVKDIPNLTWDNDATLNINPSNPFNLFGELPKLGHEHHQYKVHVVVYKPFLVIKENLLNTKFHKVTRRDTSKVKAMTMKFQVARVLEVEIYDFSAIYELGNLLGVEIVNEEGKPVAVIHARAPQDPEELVNAIVSTKLHVEDLTPLARGRSP